MDVKLIVVGGKFAGTAIPVTGAKLFIGRADDCHVRPQSELVSRHHCAILVEEGFISVRDFGSRNGTFVNDQRITGERELKAGDRVKIGPLELEVQLAVSVGGKKKPKVRSIHEAAARTVQSSQGESKDDLDISSWLEEDSAVPPTLATDTQQISGTKTTSISIDGAHTPSATGEDSGPEVVKEKIPKTHGNLAPEKKPASRDSGDAADELLRQFFGRKR
jgi:predicted component of type VI protein secretion system